MVRRRTPHPTGNSEAMFSAGTQEEDTGVSNLPRTSKSIYKLPKTGFGVIACRHCTQRTAVFF